MKRPVTNINVRRTHPTGNVKEYIKDGTGVLYNDPDFGDATCLSITKATELNRLVDGGEYIITYSGADIEGYESSRFICVSELKGIFRLVDGTDE